MSKDNAIEEMFEQVEEVKDNSLKSIPDQYKKPQIGDPEWTEYILSHLSDKEFRTHKGNKYPTTDGLRRVCRKLLGKISQSRSRVISPGNESNNFTVTVEHTLLIKEYGDDGDLLEITGVADVNAKNLDPPFNRYITANCSTRAMGRAYRDALQLQTCVAEELSNVAETDEDDEDTQPATDVQKAAIKRICKINNIDINKFINLGANKHKSLDNVLTGTARKMIAVLNGYDSGKNIPEEIKL